MPLFSNRWSTTKLIAFFAFALIIYNTKQPSWWSHEVHSWFPHWLNHILDLIVYVALLGVIFVSLENAEESRISLG